MPGWLIIALAVQAGIFILWAILAFRWLFALRRRAVAQSRREFPGPGASLRALADWWSDPASRVEKWRLIGVTLLVLAISLAVGIAAP